MKTVKKVLLGLVILVLGVSVFACKPKKTPIQKLQSLVEEVRKDVPATNDGKYTQVSFVALQDALKKADEVLKKEGATKEEIEKALKELDDAKKALEEEKELVVPEGFDRMLTNKNPKLKDGKYEIAGQVFEVKNEYKSIYQSEIDKDKLNYLKNSWVNNSNVYAKMVDGLVENDRLGNIVEGLAFAKKVEDQGEEQVWTFAIRPNVPWVVNATGKQYEVNGEKKFVTAHDFVTSAKTVLDPATASATIAQLSLIKGAEEYTKALSEKKQADFSTVGVKALDDLTIEYTITAKTPYFDTYLTYSPFLPVLEDYLKEKGTKFGESENDILVNGPFRLTKHGNSAEMVFEKNELYWDLDHVYVDKIRLQYYERQSVPSRARELYLAGEIDSFSINNKDVEGWKTYIGTGDVQNPENPETTPVQVIDDATFYGLWNFNRTNFARQTTFADKTESQKTAAAKAILDKEFRLGFLHGLEVAKETEAFTSRPYDRVYRRFTVEELAKVNGKDYTQYVDDVYNERQGTSVVLSGIESQYDPVFNAEKAKQHFRQAKANLLAAGLQESDFPIEIDVLGARNLVIAGFQRAMYDQIEKIAVDENDKVIAKVIYNVASSDSEESKWLKEDYNFDLSLAQGWGPDYADPMTFLHTTVIGGDMNDNMGFHNLKEPDQLAKAQEVLGAYDAKAREAFKIVDDRDARFKALAEAEYMLIYEEGLVIPIQNRGGFAAVVGKTLPYQANKSPFGLSPAKDKNVIVSKVQLTREQREALRADYYKAQGKELAETSTITFESPAEGLWEIPKTYKGEKGKVVILPQPTQILENVDPADRLTFDGWYTDEALTQPVEKDSNGNYTYPQEDKVTYYMKTKAYVAPTEITVATPEIRIVGLNKVGESVLTIGNPDAHTDKIIHEVEIVGENKNAKTSDVLVVLRDGKVFVSPQTYGVFTVTIKGHQYLENDSSAQIKVTCVPDPEGVSTQVAKVKVGETEYQAANGEATIELSIAAGILDVEVITDKAETSSFVVGEVKRENTNSVNGELGLSFIILGKTKGTNKYTFTIGNSVVDETTGNVTTDTYTFVLNVNIVD